MLENISTLFSLTSCKKHLVPNTNSNIDWNIHEFKQVRKYLFAI